MFMLIEDKLKNNYDLNFVQFSRLVNVDTRSIKIHYENPKTQIFLH